MGGVALFFRFPFDFVSGSCNLQTTTWKRQTSSFEFCGIGIENMCIRPGYVIALQVDRFGEMVDRVWRSIGIDCRGDLLLPHE